ncbi:MAG: type II toxin-antitoxin system Phd/YefM family antitoxin [Nitrospirota bacterium]|nr:type II toxin-antitoxin system Phd/YefM family antitoxin [Nitrospirota bacterium]MDH5588200.1 type II toxin-antitoxin system Phd/YefM family antitoxin [Nitrospirota bacterium]MDH5775367.1 type II toxin-antitoxin system Phd/YefM family antitoxin [Nitrospirota bacterium]
MKPSTINIHEAKTHLSRLVDEVCNGKELILAKAGKPLVKLVPLEKAKTPRTPGFLKGKIKISADFDAPLPKDWLDDFEKS